MNLLSWFFSEDADIKKESEIEISSDSKLYYYQKDKSHVHTKTNRPLKIYKNKSANLL